MSKYKSAPLDWARWMTHPGLAEGNRPDSLSFAAMAHATQVRDFTGEPFIIHPYRVAMNIYAFYGPVEIPDPSIIAAAHLHDINEDCGVTIGCIRANFGKRCAAAVESCSELFDSETYPLLNRKERKEREIQRFVDLGNWDAVLVKCADIMDNLPSIVRNAKPKYARMYASEKNDFVKAMAKMLPASPPDPHWRALQRAEAEIDRAMDHLKGS